jgi:dUTP pyrophosphatase
LGNHNSSEEDFVVKRGDRVAQLILERICMAECLEVDELPDTERGAGGFGSTGISTEDEAVKRAKLTDSLK